MTEDGQRRLEARLDIEATVRWMRRTAKSLNRVGTDEALRHATEMLGAADMADTWAAGLKETEVDHD